MTNGDPHIQPSFYRRWARRAGTTGLFALLTAAMTWPQPLVLATHAIAHHDIFFNLWRLRWIANALATSPQRLFDGNVFYPERLVLTLSDAMLVEGFLGAPLFWIGLPPVLVHNLLLLGAIVASGVGIFVLAEHLYGNRTGAVAAGIVYSFASYRFEHYMHMELQWAVWVPWAFWALQRTIETGAWKYGVLTGGFAGLQLLSSIYYAAFLAVLLPIVAGVQLIPLDGREMRRILARLSAGAAVAACAFAVYAAPYARTSARVGNREADEVTRYSAKAKDYLTATSTNFLYGERARGLAERRLFPGAVAAVLALIGLLVGRLRPLTIAYLIGGVVAFELSLGMYGVVYPWLYEHVPLFQSLRAPARASMFCLFFLGILVAHGCTTIAPFVRPLVWPPFATVLVGVLLIEYWVAPLSLVRYHNEPPEVYSWLAQQSPGLVAEFPMPTAATLPGREPFYAYMSTFHWNPTVNGYSGYYPRSYLQRLGSLETFPETAAIDRLRRTNVTYILVHTDGYPAGESQRIVQALTDYGLRSLGRFSNGTSEAAVFRMH